MFIFSFVGVKAFTFLLGSLVVASVFGLIKKIIYGV